MRNGVYYLRLDLKQTNKPKQTLKRPVNYLCKVCGGKKVDGLPACWAICMLSCEKVRHLLSSA